MTSSEVIERLKAAKGQVRRIARECGLPYGSVRKLVTGETTDPRASTLDPLRDYFQREAERPQ